MFVICTNCNEPIPYKEDKEYTENTILVEGSDDEMLIFSLIKDREIIINNITIEAKKWIPINFIKIREYKNKFRIY